MLKLHNKHWLALACGVCMLVFATLVLHLWPGSESAVNDPMIDQSAYIPPAPVLRTRSPVTFTDVTVQSGIRYTHFNGAGLDASGLPTRYMPETLGPGVALIDFDRDGDSDIFITNSSSFSGEEDKSLSSPRMYRNEGEMQFVEVTGQVGIDSTSYGMGAAVGDYNGDGYPDLLLTGWGTLELFRNVDGTRFENVTTQVFPSIGDAPYPEWSTAGIFFDADLDGDLDLYVASYVRWTPEEDVFATIDGRNKSYATPDLYPGGSSRLFIQEQGRYLDRSVVAGMSGDEGKSMGAALWDFNHDGLMDIVVANDTQPNFLYYNLGQGRFENRALEAGIAYDANGKTRAGMGIDVADVANNGKVAIAIGNFSREPVSFFKDEGGAFFRESSQASGIAEETYTELSFGLAFADFDLDGWQDLIIANGHIEPEIGNVEAKITYRQQMQLFGNTGDGHFKNWSATAGAGFKRSIVGRGLAVGDLDGDGDIDVIAVENNGGAHLLRNDFSGVNHFLRVKVKGMAPNTDAIGAKLALVIDGEGVQTRTVRGGSSYLSQSELVQTFGLGRSTPAAVLEVTWPSGEISAYRINEFNRTVMIREDQARTAKVP